MDFKENDKLKIKNDKGRKNINLILKYAAAISASLTTMGFGMTVSWTSPALPHLKSPASECQITEIQGAWITSLSGCGTIFGYLLNPILIGREGPKRTLLFLAMPQVLSWIMIYFGRNWIFLCLARIVGGVGYGGGLCSTAIYIANIGDENTRGIFLTLIKMSINIGIFITMFLGAFFSYNAMNLALLGVPISFILSFFFMPDTNQFIGDGNFEESSQKRFSGSDFLQNNGNDIVKESGNGIRETTIGILEKERVHLLEEKFIFLRKDNSIEERSIDDDGNFKGNTLEIKEREGSIVKENVTDNLKKNMLDIKERRNNSLVENTPDIIKGNAIFHEENKDEVVKEKTTGILKEQAVDILKENKNAVKKRTLDIREEKAVGFLKESKDEADKETTSDNFKEETLALKKNEETTIKGSTIDIFTGNTNNNNTNDNLTEICHKEIEDDKFEENNIDIPKDETDHLKAQSELLTESKNTPIKEITTNSHMESRILPEERRQDVLTENTLVILKENTIIVLNEDTVDTLQENTFDYLRDKRMHPIKENSTDAPTTDEKATKEGRRNSVRKPKNEESKQEEEIEEEVVNLLKKKEIPHPLDEETKKNVLWKLFFLRNNQMALLIILIASLTDIFSGHMAIVSYTQQIFEYSGASLKAEYAALILSALKIGASLISILVIERCGRRVLFLSTGILAGLGQGLVGLFFFLKIQLKSDVSSITWLPLFGISMYEVVGSIGLSSLYYVYQGELFADDVKGPGVTCTNIIYESITFLIRFFFPLVIDIVGIFTVFWGFSISCIAGSWTTYWISPETKGKSRKEIQNLLGAKTY